MDTGNFPGLWNCKLKKPNKQQQQPSLMALNWVCLKWERKGWVRGLKIWQSNVLKCWWRWKGGWGWRPWISVTPTCRVKWFFSCNDQSPSLIWSGCERRVRYMRMKSFAEKMNSKGLTSCKAKLALSPQLLGGNLQTLGMSCLSVYLNTLDHAT